MSWWKKFTNKIRSVYGGDQPPAAAASGGCDHSSIHLREGTAEFEYFIANAELETGHNLRHGAGHLANLLSYDPGNPEWVELLERYLAAAGPDPESLIPRGDKLYYTTEAVRAYVWHKQGRLAEAVELLASIAHAKPDVRYPEAWMLGWLEPAGAVEALPAPLGWRLFAELLNRFPEARNAPLPRLREVRRWARLAERFAAQHPMGGAATMVRAGFLRKAGLFDEAVAVVRPALERAPEWHAATALGLILRQMGACAEAENAFRQAIELDPSDVSARLEAGDMFFERQQWEAALRWYQNALAKEPQQPWARPSDLFCRWKLSGDEKPLQALIELAKGGNDRARHLCNQEFYGGLPEPTDATANLLRQFREKIVSDPADAPEGEARMTLSCLEAPSNYLAFRMEMEALRHDLRLKVIVNAVPKPDPRLPVAEVKYPLWKYDGTDASPALPAPPADVVGRIAELAAMPFEEPANWAAASRVAEQLGPSRVGEVLAVMVHPPPVPPGGTALAWLPRVQYAAAEVAAWVDGGWEGSARREALLSVLHGPSDWATEAAVRVLARVGVENEAYAPDIGEAFQRLANHRPDQGFCCWEHTLFRCWLDLPHLFPTEREELEKTLRRIEERDRKKDS